MNISLSQERFCNGISIFDVGCVMKDENGTEFTITEFSGYSEIDDETGAEREYITVHLSNCLCDDIRVELEDLERDLSSGALEAVSPDWFIEEVASWRGYKDKAEQQREQAESQQKQAEAVAQVREIAEVAALLNAPRPVEHLSTQELFAKISGAPLSVAESVLVAYEGNLQRMAGASPKQMQKVPGIGKTRSEKIIAALELGKRLARFHAEKPKITSPSDIADLMMSKMRYLQKEIVCVLALDTKGGVTSTGKAGELASDVKWGKMLAEATVFEGTLNASVFHPREIFRFAIEESANSIVLVHNHPSGDPQPSQEDIRATKQLIEAGNAIGIKVLDHVVIGDGIFVSLKEEGFI